VTSAAGVRPTYDVVVVGLGIMGASALFHLSRRGVAALGVDAYQPGHRQGSSHGATRIFRRAYWEGERYVPLLDRSYAGWTELDQAADEPVTVRTGGLFVGRADSTLVRGSRDTASRCGIAHEYCDAREIRHRFPAFHVSGDAVAVYEPDALTLMADRARQTYLSLASAGGADLAHSSPVRSVRVDGAGGLTVIGDGWRSSCGAVILATGCWIGRFLPEELGDWITAMRIPVFQFDIRPSAEPDHTAGRFPVFLYEAADGALVYGIPQTEPGGGVKVGFHNRQLSLVDPDGARQPPTDAERLDVWRAIKDLLPGVAPTGRGTACVYTISADESFLIGRSRSLPGVAFASACSGHGFKFAPAIGETLAELALDGRATMDLSAFAPERRR